MTRETKKKDNQTFEFFVLWNLSASPDWIVTLTLETAERVEFWFAAAPVLACSTALLEDSQKTGVL